MSTHADNDPKTGTDSPIFFVRLSRNESRQHYVFVTCFVALVISGFMVHLPETIIAAFGDVGRWVFLSRNTVHRLAAVTMLAVCVYHLYYLAMKPNGRRWFRDMLPELKDLTDVLQNMKYYLHLQDQPPEFKRFNYKHKAEYAALWVGNILMTASGLILWTESSWSKFAVDIAQVVHGMEAILASLAIMVWHLYEVHLRPHKFPGDRMWIEGVIPEHEAEEEYTLHYQEVMADPELRRIFLRGPTAQQEPSPTAEVEDAAPPAQGDGKEVGR